MLYRIKALRDFGGIKAGDLGGYIEKESNLSHNGDAWLYEDAMVYGDAHVYGEATIDDIAQVYGDARVYGNALICGNALVSGNAEVNGNVAIGGNVWVNGNARIQSCDDLCTFGYFGPSNFHTTAFKIEGGGIGVECGWFQGTLNKFRNKIKEIYGINDYAVEYLMIADLIEHKLSGRAKK